jgi:hypothetical protein
MPYMQLSTYKRWLSKHTAAKLNAQNRDKRYEAEFARSTIALYADSQAHNNG